MPTALLRGQMCGLSKVALQGLLLSKVACSLALAIAHPGAEDGPWALGVSESDARVDGSEGPGGSGLTGSASSGNSDARLWSMGQVMG
jgi:hypothetical protein